MEDKFSYEYKVNRSIKFCTTQDGVSYLYVTKSFAEKNISEEARKLAKATSTHYIWIAGKTSAVVLFELPKLFNAQFHDILPQLLNYCMSYVRKLGLNDNVIYSRFLDNYNK